MRLLGNIFWFICGGFFMGLAWCAAGLLWCITIVGIPIGTQCFKFASMAFFPFDKQVVYTGGTASMLINVLWCLISGLELAVCHLICGAFMCVTIIGIPFGLQHFKMAQLAFAPFGASLSYTRY